MDLFYHLENIDLIVISTIFVLLSIYYFYFLVSIFFGILKIRSHKASNSKVFSVSIIVPFRNERENLKRNIESVIKQDYPSEKYEVIFVDDNSTDGSSEIIEEYKKLSKIKLILSKVENENSARGHKKTAIAKGIEKSKNEIIVTTDADCFFGPGWLKSLVQNFDENTGLVSGPVEYKSDGSLFSSLQKLEFSGLILSGAGLIGTNQPIICNGANLAFRKDAFYEVGGYASHMEFSSGDDEFLMQKIAYTTNWNIGFAFSKEALVFTSPSENLESFIQQRKRWASKSLYYLNNKIKLKLVMIFMFYLSLIVFPFVSLIQLPAYLILFLLIFLAKIFLEYIILLAGKHYLFSELKFVYYLPAQFLQPLYLIFSSIAGLFGRFHWKGRDLVR